MNHYRHQQVPRRINHSLIVRGLRDGFPVDDDLVTSDPVWYAAFLHLARYFGMGLA